MNATMIKDKLAYDLSGIDKIKGIGQTGDINAEPVPGNSDIDLFVLCTAIPTEDERKQVYQKYSEYYSECSMNVCNGGIWGYGDILLIDRIDVMFMYFTFEEMEQYLDEVLQGMHLGQDGGFYPTGRLSSVEGINILYESDYIWTALKAKVKQHPRDLFEMLFNYHISCVLNDEDLGRTILRKEVLFYHSVLENALDHLLQALFAVNLTYFPSRKRSEKYINAFAYKPDDCSNRLLQLVKNSVQSETIEASVQELRSITAEIKEIGRLVFGNISSM